MIQEGPNEFVTTSTTSAVPTTPITHLSASTAMTSLKGMLPKLSFLPVDIFIAGIEFGGGILFKETLFWQPIDGMELSWPLEPIDPNRFL